MYSYGDTRHQTTSHGEILYTKDSQLEYADSGFELAFNLVYLDQDERKLKVVDTEGYLDKSVLTQDWESWARDYQKLATHQCTGADRSRFKESAADKNQLDFF